jgi:hypothetical protein
MKATGDKMYGLNKNVWVQPLGVCLGESFSYTNGFFPPSLVGGGGIWH